MEDNKAIWLSKTFWGSILAIGATAAQAFGITDASGYANDVLTIIGGLLAIFGRVKATTKIG